jgi:hypothetical protein
MACASELTPQMTVRPGDDHSWPFPDDLVRGIADHARLGHRRFLHGPQLLHLSRGQHHCASDW